MNATSAVAVRAGPETYNARVVHLRRIHESLMVVRVETDEAIPDFEPGQYTVLGLDAGERRADGIGSTTHTGEGRPIGLVRRAYSMSCPLLNEHSQLVRCGDLPYLEFYVTLVSRPSDEPPMLTPRLFALKEGSRLFVGPHPHGRYRLDPVRDGDDVIFLGTGTGEAPHNAMLAELLARGHSGQLVCATCVRNRSDLGYLELHRELERRYANYHYFPLTTREPENLDATRIDYIGKHYLQDTIRRPEFLDLFSGKLDPARTHAFICGNPAMIGLPKKGRDGHLVYPEPPGVVETLLHLGLKLDEPRHPASIHFEKYW